MSGPSERLVSITANTVGDLNELFGPGSSDVGREILGLATPGFASQVEHLGELWVARAIPLRTGTVLNSSALDPIDAMRDLARQLREHRARA